MDRYIVTGNDFVSLPCIRERDGALLDVTFLYRSLKGAINVKGRENEPFLLPFFCVDGKHVVPRQLSWRKTEHWIPSFTFVTAEAEWECTYLAAREARGFLMHLSCKNKTGRPLPLQWGASGCWSETDHATNNDFRMELPMRTWTSWHGLPVFGAVQGVPLFVFSFFFDGADGERPNGENSFTCSADADAVRYCYSNRQICPPEGEVFYNLYFGLGYEAVAAVTSGLYQSRRGYDSLFEDTAGFLHARAAEVSDSRLSELLNYNLFFSYFFAAGITLDTEEFVLVTSRSPRYYVSAAYWDRDSLLWNFPAILSVDKERARQMLDYVFRVQNRNVGIHSRYIDGTILEPGFELDELCAPLLALARYLEKSGDIAYAEHGYVRLGVQHILNVLKEHRHPSVALYDTMLYPSDDMHTYPYLTYDNVLAECALRSLVPYAEKLGLDAHFLAEESAAIGLAVEEHCLADFEDGKCYAWSTDLQGRYKFYDEPPGSLILMPLYGHEPADPEAYRRTIDKLYSVNYRYSFAGTPFAEVGCAHSPHPWVLSFCNSMLAGRDVPETLAKLKAAQMDNGIACEAIDEQSGSVATGAAFATCAGFLAYSLMRVLVQRK